MPADAARALGRVTKLRWSSFHDPPTCVGHINHLDFAARRPGAATSGDGRWCADCGRISFHFGTNEILETDQYFMPRASSFHF